MSLIELSAQLLLQMVGSFAALFSLQVGELFLDLRGRSSAGFACEADDWA